MNSNTLEKPSVAREFFLKITKAANPQDELRRLVAATPPTFESEWLDFKGGKNIADHDIKRTWSEALSGFANTQGGVLVWGIDARKDPTTGVDSASSLSLVPNPAGLKSRLNELHAQATEPPVLGVEIEAYPLAAPSGDGFVICYIPESSFRPHRAEQANRQYVIRAGDDFVAASVSLLRNLFFPQTRCRLIPTLQVRRKVEGDYRSVTVTGHIKNTGSATAFDTYIIVHYEPDGLTRHYEGWKAGPRLRPWHGQALRPIHPGITEHFFGLEVKDPETSTGFLFQIQIFAKDAEPFEWVFLFALSEAKDGTLIQGLQRQIA